jgi:hypothetical protein
MSRRVPDVRHPEKENAMSNIITFLTYRNGAEDAAAAAQR